MSMSAKEARLLTGTEEEIVIGGDEADFPRRSVISSEMDSWMPSSPPLLEFLCTVSIAISVRSYFVRHRCALNS